MHVECSNSDAELNSTERQYGPWRCADRRDDSDLNKRQEDYLTG
jgi:hypothetical protein